MNMFNIYKTYRPGLVGMVRWQVEGGVVRDSGTQGGGQSSWRLEWPIGHVAMWLAYPTYHALSLALF